MVLPILKCLYTNADQLTNKIPSWLLGLEIKKKLDIIGITEVKPNSRYKPHLAEYSLAEVGNYKMFWKNLEKDNGRCLLLYINKELKGYCLPAA
jgi:hypothetical protein